jgi:hypothetical protein
MSRSCVALKSSTYATQAYGKPRDHFVRIEGFETSTIICSSKSTEPLILQGDIKMASKIVPAASQSRTGSNAAFNDKVLVTSNHDGLQIMNVFIGQADGTSDVQPGCR